MSLHGTMPALRAGEECHAGQGNIRRTCQGNMRRILGRFDKQGYSP